jgi:hypothetical protein
MIYVIHNNEKAKKVGRRGREAAHVAFDKDKIREKESLFYMQALTEFRG